MNNKHPDSMQHALCAYVHKEIAKLMGITPTQVKAHLGKACHTLGHVWDN